MNVAAEIVARQHPEKEIVPAALLYYHVSDPVISVEDELSPEEINQKILKELCTAGLVSEDERIVSYLDKNFKDKSFVIPVERKKDGTFSARSSVMRQEDYETVSKFVSHKIRQLGMEILAGNIAVNPCRQGTMRACTYCAFRGICDFEERIPGYHMRFLEGKTNDELLLRMRQELEQEGFDSM